MLSVDYKNKGNEYFNQGEYQKAIQEYSQAITIDGSVSIYYSNRAKSYFNIKEYDKAYKDSLHAIELDDQNIKAHFILGQSMANLAVINNDKEMINNSIKKMTKALTLCAGQQKKHYEKNLYIYINRAKKLRWFMQEKEDNSKKQEIMSYLKK